MDGELQSIKDQMRFDFRAIMQGMAAHRDALAKSIPS